MDLQTTTLVSGIVFLIVLALAAWSAGRRRKERPRGKTTRERRS